MALSTQPYKGARDFYPEDMRLRNYIFRKMRLVSEKYGYEEYDAPLLEHLELYQAKTGEEIVNEQTYAFTDRGGRQVAIRPEMTPSVSRMVAARRQELAYPVRWYSIPVNWRYERPQKGRLREFWQLNVDIFGLSGLEAEQEIIELADAIMRAFKAKRDMYSIKLNSRKFMDAIMHNYLGLTPLQSHTLAKLIDRMHKLPQSEVLAQAEALLTPSQRDEGLANKLFALLAIKNLSDLPEPLSKHPSALQLKYLLDMLRASGISNATFDISIMRGFDYYTDIVFEVYDNNPENNRSMFGGGRYDGLVGLFGVEPVPTVGFAMGDVTMQNFLETHGLLPKLRPKTDVYIILIGDVFDKAKTVIKSLREMGLKAAVDFTGRSLDKQIKTATKKDIHYVLFIGQKELDEERYVLKNLLTGEEEKHGAARLVSIVKDYRKA